MAELQCVTAYLSGITYPVNDHKTESTHVPELQEHFELSFKF